MSEEGVIYDSINEEREVCVVYVGDGWVVFKDYLVDKPITICIEDFEKYFVEADDD